MAKKISNRLPVLAERIRQANDKAKAASAESAEQYLEAGRFLVEAKDTCQHYGFSERDIRWVGLQNYRQLFAIESTSPVANSTPGIDGQSTPSHLRYCSPNGPRK